MREEKSQFQPAQNTERYPLDHPVIPLAVTVPENADDQVARPVASEVRILPSHGEPHPIETCPERKRLFQRWDHDPIFL